MARSSTDELIDGINSKANYIKTLPRTMDSCMREAIMNWKLLVTEASLPLVLNSAPNSRDSVTELPSSDYMIDLRAGIKILPRRFESQQKSIDVETRHFRTKHEKEIMQGQVKCVKINEEGKQFKYEPSRSEMPHDSTIFIGELHKFSFPDKVPPEKSAEDPLTYPTNACAYPNCGNTEGIENCITHLQLCERHEKELEHNIQYKWMPPKALKNYKKIETQRVENCEEYHYRIYYQLLPQLNKWIEQIDSIILTDCSGVGSEVSAIDAWLVLQLRPMRQLLMLMKSFIFIYRMYLNSDAIVIEAITALFVHVLESATVKEAIVQETVRMIRLFCGIVSCIFIYFGIGILYTLDIIISDDAYLATILGGFGLTLIAIGVFLLAAAAGPRSIVGGIAVLGTSFTSTLLSFRMGRERERRDAVHPHLIQIHLDLTRAQERMWQWINNA
ncbi:unnamed protein product [Adineta ricciae]|uniref:Uncharacterized protein n=1 Tax=Adineta ricciae TaxID=249248 RepID=A0A815VHW0_ADIRI|nr:unnamed protein product [Adineta ricciae]CAF1635995.1 unnamed protein product [Adineta ricciae]